LPEVQHGDHDDGLRLSRTGKCGMISVRLTSDTPGKRRRPQPLSVGLALHVGRLDGRARSKGGGVGGVGWCAFQVVCWLEFILYQVSIRSLHSIPFSARARPSLQMRGSADLLNLTAGSLVPLTYFTHSCSGAGQRKVADYCVFPESNWNGSKESRHVPTINGSGSELVAG